MKISYKTWAGTFGVLGLALLFAPNSTADCGGLGRPMASHTSWHPQPGQIRLLPAAFAAKDDGDNDDATIVGFWHQQLLLPGTYGSKDTIFDDALAQWHSDGTELQNTATHPPSIGGNFCMGVWEKVSTHTYKLNHFPLIWDGTTFIGPSNLREEVTVTADGKRYRGTFTQDFYDPTGKIIVAHYQGIVTGTRITVDSTAESIF